MIFQYCRHTRHDVAYWLQWVSLNLEGLQVEIIESLGGFPYGKGAYVLHLGDAHRDGLVHGRNIYLCLGADGIALQLVFTDIEDEPYIFTTDTFMMGAPVPTSSPTSGNISVTIPSVVAVNTVSLM